MHEIIRVMYELINSSIFFSHCRSCLDSHQIKILCSDATELQVCVRTFFKIIYYYELLNKSIFKIPKLLEN